MDYIPPPRLVIRTILSEHTLTTLEAFRSWWLAGIEKYRDPANLEAWKTDNPSHPNYKGFHLNPVLDY